MALTKHKKDYKIQNNINAPTRKLKKASKSESKSKSQTKIITKLFKTFQIFRFFF